MFDRLSRSWQLVKASATVLQQDKHLLVFPLISSLAMLLVVAGFALPILGLAGLDGLDRLEEEGPNAVVYATAFAFYVVQYFVIFYFNAALVGATMMRLDGGAPTIGDGLRIANSRIGPILGYAVIAATVGVILRAIQERLGFLGRFVVGLLGAGWAVATFLVVPVLVSNEVGPVQAIKDSAGMLKKTWGENVIGQAGMSLAITIMGVGVTLLGLGLIYAAAMTGSGALAVLMVVVLVVSLLLLALVGSTLSGIYAAALYRYAANGSATTGFDNSALQAAFQPKAR
jgi:hypothetical protein